MLRCGWIFAIADCPQHGMNHSTSCVCIFLCRHTFVSQIQFDEPVYDTTIYQIGWFFTAAGMVSDTACSCTNSGIVRSKWYPQTWQLNPLYAQLCPHSLDNATFWSLDSLVHPWLSAALTSWLPNSCTVRTWTFPFCQTLDRYILARACPISER